MAKINPVIPAPISEDRVKAKAQLGEAVLLCVADFLSERVDERLSEEHAYNPFQADRLEDINPQ